MSKWSEISTILGTAIVAQSSSYFHHLFPRVYAQMTDGRIAVHLWLLFDGLSAVAWYFSRLIQFSVYVGVSVWACLCGRIRGLRIDSAFPSVCYFNIHTTNNEPAHLTVVEFTDCRNFQNNNFHVWNVEWKIRTEGNTNIWSLSECETDK